MGRNQCDDFLDNNILTVQNIDIVRRLTGGRALLHDKELTYSYICPVDGLSVGESVSESYKEICKFLIAGFEKLGIELDFPNNKKASTKFEYCMALSTSADLTFQGKKLIGSAQFRKEGYILQHGSILFDYDKSLIAEIFNENIDENSLTCLKIINPDITLDDVKNVLISSAENFRGVLVK